MAKLKPTLVPDTFWNAIVDNDVCFDDQFFYGVQTTGIFCRPSCKSRLPKRENVRIFKNAYVALDENFRPCKRCRPDGLNLPAEEWINQVAGWIDVHFTETVALETLAETFHGSPYHLQRLFTQFKGQSPLAYAQQKRLEKALQLLQASDLPIAEIAGSAGFGSTAYFITFFKNSTGLTPARYRKSFHLTGRGMPNGQAD
ncbi:AraC family transcriptional regulator of adaptative response / methylphosphotriester-DNA alkyltransferase methyltransferase [Planomicrobium koreense]|uniref:AraC family transcriptional regulator of adaptative response / methylphosphotriester-DNA alkyltransferase methyltransferase n=1 Tax=Planococcus koreensis TaxID=112331 RepID=A0A7W8CW67_9BACL|nr:bifunctional transcriptional activator/DNA repair enzyme AdaA [Planococcus koreensis]MBB5181337.1 AraC family transcriptional regulator of adaptative response / methylphosphotriester-DNA alkyltransferase methyltransferase [Planococcus koreensis]